MSQVVQSHTALITFLSMVFDLNKQCELELSDPSIRKNRKRLNQLLANDFEEVGKSGRKYSKAEIIEELVNEDNISFSIQDFSFVLLFEDCVLVKYQTTLNNQSAYRCSIWKKYEDQWQIHYH